MMFRKKPALMLVLALMLIIVGTTTAFATDSINFNDVPPSESPMDSSIFNNAAESNVEYNNANSINNFSEEPDTGSDGELPTTLVAVRHDDERKFTPEEWTEILEQIERGEVHWAD